MDIRFALITADEIVSMAEAEGLSLCAIYGDYAFSPFDANSPFMHCVFRQSV